MTDKDRTDEVLKSIEGLRQQQSAQHDEQLSIAKSSHSILVWWQRLWERLGRNRTWPGDSK
jgi:hypothetical protein